MSDTEDWAPDAAGLAGGKVSEIECERLLLQNAAWDKWMRAHLRAKERFEADTAEPAKAYLKATKDSRDRYTRAVTSARKAYRDALEEIEINARKKLDVAIPQPLRELTAPPIVDEDQQ